MKSAACAATSVLQQQAAYFVPVGFDQLPRCWTGLSGADRLARNADDGNDAPRGTGEEQFTGSVDFTEVEQSFNDVERRPLRKIQNHSARNAFQDPGLDGRRQQR